MPDPHLLTDGLGGPFLLTGGLGVSPPAAPSGAGPVTNGGLLLGGLGTRHFLTGGLVPSVAVAAAFNGGLLVGGLGGPHLLTGGLGPGSGTGPAPAATFFDAFVAWFKGCPLMTDAFPGGLQNARAAPRPVYPYLVMTTEEPQSPTSPEDRAFRCHLGAVADDADAAESAGVRLADTLLNPVLQPGLRFRYRGGVWREVGTRTVPPPATIDAAGVGPRGDPLFSYSMTFEFDGLLIEDSS